MKDIECLRCGMPMRYLKREKIQLGEMSWILGEASNLLSGALEVDIYACTNCGKIEFYMPESETVENELPQKQCPNCRKVHDFDYPKCPFCKYEYF